MILRPNDNLIHVTETKRKADVSKNIAREVWSWLQNKE